jgi:hypothetical protein
MTDSAVGQAASKAPARKALTDPSGNRDTSAPGRYHAGSLIRHHPAGS